MFDVFCDVEELHFGVITGCTMAAPHALVPAHWRLREISLGGTPGGRARLLDALSAMIAKPDSSESGHTLRVLDVGLHRPEDTTSFAFFFSNAAPGLAYFDVTLDWWGSELENYICEPGLYRLSVRLTLLTFPY